MASLCEIGYKVSLQDSQGVTEHREPPPVRFAPGAGDFIKVEKITVTASTFTALSAPTGARALLLILGQATGLTLKGVTGDTGTTLCPTTLPIGLDLIIPLGATPSIGLASSNTSDQVVTAWWF